MAEIESLRQQVDGLREQIAELEKADEFTGDYTQLYNYILIDGKYSAVSVKRDMEIPEVLVVPNNYKGVEVAYTGNELINGLPVKTIIFESGVECSAFLCGYGNNCPTLENIVFLSENPDDAIYREINNDRIMPLQLNNPQLAGGCTIYVPDTSVDAYIATWESFPEYASLIRPLSELDAEIMTHIK